MAVKFVSTMGLFSLRDLGKLETRLNGIKIPVVELVLAPLCGTVERPFGIQEQGTGWSSLLQGTFWRSFKNLH